MVVSIVISTAFVMLLYLHPDINIILEHQLRQAQLDTTFNQVNYRGKKVLTGLDQTKQHEIYHNCCDQNSSQDSNFEFQMPKDQNCNENQENIVRLCIEEADRRH